MKKGKDVMRTEEKALAYDRLLTLLKNVPKSSSRTIRITYHDLTKSFLVEGSGKRKRSEASLESILGKMQPGWCCIRARVVHETICGECAHMKEMSE